MESNQKQQRIRRLPKLRTMCRNQSDLKAVLDIQELTKEAQAITLMSRVAARIRIQWVLWYRFLGLSIIRALAPHKVQDREPWRNNRKALGLAHRPMPWSKMNFLHRPRQRTRSQLPQLRRSHPLRLQPWGSNWRDMSEQKDSQGQEDSSISSISKHLRALEHIATHPRSKWWQDPTIGQEVHRIPRVDSHWRKRRRAQPAPAML